MPVFRKLMTIDRRLIYLVLAFSITLPLLQPLGLFQPIRNPYYYPHFSMAEQFYDILSALPEGSAVLLSLDFSNTDKYEIAPMLRIVTDLCLQRRHRLLLISLWPNGCQRALPYLEPYLQEYEALYGIDYLVLGNMQPYRSFLQESILDFQSACQKYSNNQTWPLDVYPILNGIETSRDISAVVCFNSGDPGYTHWIQYWYATGACQTILSCMVAINFPNSLSAYNAGNLKGAVGGDEGVYELEQRHGVIGAGHGRLDSFGLGHSTILLFILLGNIGYLGARLCGELQEGRPEKESRWKVITYDEE